MPEAPVLSGRGGRLLVAALSGALLGLTTPSTSFLPLLPVALVPLMIVLRKESARGAALPGFLFGIAFWLTTIQWIGFTVHHFGGFPRPVAALAVLISAGILSVPLAAMTSAVAAAGPPIGGTGGLAWVATWAAAWVVQEAARIHVLGGFPWALLAAPLAAVPPLAQSAAYGGVLLTSALVVVVNGLVAAAVLAAPLRRKAAFAGAALVLVIGAWLAGTARIRGAAAPSAEGLPNLRVLLVQPNVEQAVRFTAAKAESTYQDLLAMTRAAARADRPDLVVWPESAAPWAWQTSGRFRADLLALCRDEHVAILLNTVWSADPEDDDAPYFNSALLVAASGPVLPPYHKQRLVPFGEYVPLGPVLRRIRPISQAVPGSFSPGAGGPPMPLGPWRLGGAVCYEVVYPWIARAHVRAGTNLLFTLTNDAWFGTLSARRQHWQSAVFRSIETGVPLVRAAVTGLTGWVDAVGQGRQIEPDREGTMLVTLGGRSGTARPLPPPPAVAVGEALAWVCAAGLFVCILRRRVPKPRGPTGRAPAAP